MVCELGLAAIRAYLLQQYAPECGLREWYADGDHVSSFSAFMDKSMGWESSILHEGKISSLYHYGLGDSFSTKRISTTHCLSHRSPRQSTEA